MNGQWIGRYHGASTGLLVVNIDERRTQYQGVAYLSEDNKALPSDAAFFSTRDKNEHFQFRTDLLLPINPFSSRPDTWDSVKSNYAADINISQSADVSGSWSDKSLSLR